MAFTYAQLKQAIQDFTENSETTFVNNLPTFIRLAEEKILQNVQLELFRKTQTANLVSSNKYLNVPSDFLAPFSLSYTANPFPYGSHQSSSQYNIPNSISRANLGFSADIALFQTPEATSGRSLGDIQGQNDGNVEQQDALLMTQYIVYKYGGGSIADLTTDNISYIENTMLPYMAARQSTYSNFYNPSLMVGTTFMDFKDPSFLREYQNDDAVTGQPRYYALFDNSNFVISPTPDQDYSIQLSYFYRPQSITAGADNETTWLSTNAETTLLYASLIEANIFMKGEQDVTQSYMMRVSEGIKQIKMLGESKQTTDLYRTGQIVRAKE